MANDDKSNVKSVLPGHSGLFYGGGWHEPGSGKKIEIMSPGDGSLLGLAAVASATDVDRAVEAARSGFLEWRRVLPLERARILRRIGQLIRDNAADLALLDAADCGNPVAEMTGDAHIAAAWFDFFAGLVTEMKGASIPMGPDAVNFSVREPIGVVARIMAFNHPFLFTAGKLAAPLAAGNAVIVKPPEQAPLSGLRIAELIGDLLPAGVLGVITGGREAGSALSSHPGVDVITLIGSVPTGRAIMRDASATLKHVALELGGKNSLIAFPDADVEEVAAAAVKGMNYTWCGQSCGSLSRVFLHDDIHDAVIERMRPHLAKYRPGNPTDPTTTMGSIISRVQFDRIKDFIASAHEQGARLVWGGGPPEEKSLSDGFFILPTVFCDVTQDMRIASEEIFGPVQSILRWTDEQTMLAEVNALEYGLTCAIFTENLQRAHRTAAAVEVGYVWVNTCSTHFLGAPFGGQKQSGLGREECLEELLLFTQEKNIHIRMR